jgi:hypothetical protein
MRKIILTAFSFILLNSSFAQEAAEKKIQAGLIVQTGLNFGRTGTKLMDSDGTGSEFTIGVNMNYALAPTIAFMTGLEVDFETLKYKTTTTSATYYRYNDTEIIQNEESSKAQSLFLLTNRTQRPVYITIPTMMLFRTKFFGYMRYFGKFGLKSSFLLGNKIDDTGFNMENNSAKGTPISATNENMKSRGDMFFFKTAVGFSGGTEWNFSGSTSLVAELGYYYGFVPLHVTNKEKNMTLYTSGENNGTGNDLYYTNKSSQSQLLFKVSILF